MSEHESSPEEMLVFAEEFSDSVIPPGMLPDGFVPVMAAFTLILTQFSEGKHNACQCEVCSDLRQIVNTAEGLMP